MINSVKDFFKTTILGGFFVILPIILFAFFVVWIGEFLISAFLPLSNIYHDIFKFDIRFCHFLSLLSFIGICFSLGIIVRTRLGNYVYSLFERLLKKFPGYALINDILEQFVKERKSFSKVVLIDRLSNNVLETGFVTDTYVLNNNEYYVVFIPTGPNPTTGFIIHIEKIKVIKESNKIDKSMKSIISCGAGTNKIWGDDNV